MRNIKHSVLGLADFEMNLPNLPKNARRPLEILILARQVSTLCRELSGDSECASGDLSGIELIKRSFKDHHWLENHQKDTIFQPHGKRYLWSRKGILINPHGVSILNLARRVSPKKARSSAVPRAEA